MTSNTHFPAGFQWGTATAAHQIEGGNTNNDWWQWEHADRSPCAEPSGDACDSWNRWAQDVELVASLGLDCYRFSVEWSRIEPAEGEFSKAAIAHYRGICEALRNHGVSPVVTFHHFTTPRWVSADGGWENPAVVDRFGTFCNVTATALADVMGAACTINEPNVVATVGWLAAMFPPGKSDRALRRLVNQNMISAHRRAVEVIRTAAPGVPVGLTLSMADYQAVDGGESKRDQIRRGSEDVFLEATAGDDFLGVQTYSRFRVGPTGTLPPEPGVPVLTMGYEYWPQSLEATLRRAWDVTGGSIPLWVTENGIGTDDDSQRVAYVHQALQGVLAAIADGVDVRGYTYWSLLDNFEWAFGYGPLFGLVEVDRDTFARTPKPSAAYLAQIAAHNMLVEPPG